MTSHSDNIKWKIINDPIHKSISLHPFLIKIIDTPEFQRLRDIKQLGLCFKVYPSATCTRFEHCIGVCHLAWRMMELLKSHSDAGGDNNIVITDNDKLCVAIAGLCHDLGHGAFSHTWESFMKKAVPGANWRHEDASIKIFNRIWEKLDKHEKSKYDMGENERKLICAIISGDSSQVEFANDKPFLFEIVANKNSGVDVDKWDYFARDNYYLAMGTKISFEYERLMQCARILWDDPKKPGSIHYRNSEKLNFYHMFYIRWLLHHRAYKHRVVKILEGMFIDALLKADNDILLNDKKLSECVNDLDSFLSLNDDVYHKMLFLNPDHPARKIMERIQTRDLYKRVGKKITRKVNLSAEDIERQMNCDLTKDQFYITVDTFDYGMGDQDPIPFIPFYKIRDDDDDDDFDHAMLPSHFQESRIYCICRDVDEETCTKAKKAFNNWVKEFLPQN